MNNLKLRSLIENISYWVPRHAIRKKTSCKLDDRVWDEMERPVTRQVLLPIVPPIRNIFEKEYDQSQIK